MDDTKFKTGKVKEIRKSSLRMNVRAHRRSPPSLKMEIVLTKFGVVDRNLTYSGIARGCRFIYRGLPQG